MKLNFHTPYKAKTAHILWYGIHIITYFADTQVYKHAEIH